MTTRQAFDAARHDGEQRPLTPCFDEFVRAVAGLEPRRPGAALGPGRRP